MTRGTGWTSSAAVRLTAETAWLRGAVLRELHLGTAEPVASSSVAEPEAGALQPGPEEPPGGDTLPPKSEPAVAQDGPPAALRRMFPLRVRLAGPTRDELAGHFTDASAWARQLAADAAAVGYELRVRSVRVPGLGNQSVPVAAVIPSAAAALALLGRPRAKEAERYAAALAVARAFDPAAADLALARPLDVLAAGSDWPLLLAIAGWFREHPRPGVYPRQIPVAGVHSKVIEGHRRLLVRLLDAVLAPSAVDRKAKDFAGRYGLRAHARRVRVRGSSLLLAGGVGGDREVDVEWDLDLLAALDAPGSGVEELLVLENQTAFLAVPGRPGRLVLWGAGYGADDLVAALPWRDQVRVRYWGDIDTHGLSILSRVRVAAPHTGSLLMDVSTLLAHRTFWGSEDKPYRV